MPDRRTDFVAARGPVPRSSRITGEYWVRSTPSRVPALALVGLSAIAAVVALSFMGLGGGGAGGGGASAVERGAGGDSAARGSDDSVARMGGGSPGGGSRPSRGSAFRRWGRWWRSRSGAWAGVGPGAGVRARSSEARAAIPRRVGATIPWRAWAAAPPARVRFRANGSSLNHRPRGGNAPRDGSRPPAAGNAPRSANAPPGGSPPRNGPPSPPAA